jgi:hypothetical protein
MPFDQVYALETISTHSSARTACHPSKESFLYPQGTAASSSHFPPCTANTYTYSM